MEPFLDELKGLSTGVQGKLWDGQVCIVRVHLLFYMGDIPSITKIAKLLGHNALFGCRFCLVEGINTTGTYVSDKIAQQVCTGKRMKTVRKKIFDVHVLPLRTEIGTFKVFREIEEAISSRGKGAEQAISRRHVEAVRSA